MKVNYICPVCKKPLIKTDNRFVCGSYHVFDISKEGYVNLNVKSSGKISGDNKDMVRARIAFLNQGYYDPLKDAIVKELYPVQSLLDVGCGTGYYTSSFLSVANQVFGVDISKLAIKHAAKQYKNVSFAVASCYDLPFADDSMDIITSIFSPKACAEYARVLKPDGILLEVCPATDHLIELKNLLYGQNAYKNQDKTSFDMPFILKNQKRITYDFTVFNKDINALLEMTPYFYKTSQSAKQKINDIACIKLTADFLIKTYSFN